MAKTTQITIPLTALSAGAHGPFTSGLLPPALTGYELDFTNDATWPAAGDVIQVTVEQSNDNGQNWQFDASLTMGGGQWKTRQGVNTNTSGWSVSLDNQGSTTRKARISFNVLQACKLGVTLSSL